MNSRCHAGIGRRTAAQSIGAAGRVRPNCRHSRLRRFNGRLQSGAVTGMAFRRQQIGQSGHRITSSERRVSGSQRTLESKWHRMSAPNPANVNCRPFAVTGHSRKQPFIVPPHESEVDRKRSCLFPAARFCGLASKRRSHHHRTAQIDRLRCNWPASTLMRR